MDLDKLSNGEKIAGVSAILLFVFMFFDWFSVDVSGGGGAFSASISEGGSAWDALDNIPIFLVITIIAALVVVALRLSDSTFEPPVSANAVVAVLGAISVLLILYRIIDTPGEGGEFRQRLGRHQPRLRHLPRPDRGGRNHLRRLQSDAGGRRLVLGLQQPRRRQPAAASASRRNAPQPSATAAERLS